MRKTECILLAVAGWLLFGITFCFTKEPKTKTVHTKVYVPKISTITKTNWLKGRDYVKYINIHDTTHSSSLRYDSIIKEVTPMAAVAIIDNFFTKNHYLDTVVFSKDSLFISDTIYENKVMSRMVSFSRAEQKNKNKNKFLLGGFAGGSRYTYDFGLSAAYINRRGIGMGCAYGVRNKFVCVSVYKTIDIGK